MRTEKQREYSRAYYLQNKEKFRKKNLEYYSKNKVLWIGYKGGNNKERTKSYMSNFHLRRKYGIDVNTYNNLLSLQCGCCAICGKPASDYKRLLAVDHNHLTGKIRGLLCVKCNGGLGCFEENPMLFDKAKEYLNQHQK